LSSIRLRLPTSIMKKVATVSLCLLVAFLATGFCGAANDDTDSKGKEKCPASSGSQILDILREALDKIESSLCLSATTINNNTPVDCIWGAWTEWGTCSASCRGGANGTEVRKRSIEQAAEHGGVSCGGQASESRICDQFTLCGPYKLVTSGSDCNWITSREECTHAKQELGLTTEWNDSRFGEAHLISQFNNVRGCYFSRHVGGFLGFNTYVGSTVQCGAGYGSDIQRCLCRV